MKVTEASISAAIDKAAEHIDEAKLVIDRVVAEINRNGADMPGLDASGDEEVAFNQSLTLVCQLDNKCADMQRAVAKYHLRRRTRDIKRARRAKAARA